MTPLDIIFSLIMLGAIVLVGLSLFFESKTDIASVPTLPWVQKKMIETLKKKFKDDESCEIAELGSGWGTLVFGLAKAFPNSSVYGYEMSPIAYHTSVLLNKFFGDEKRIQLFKDDFFEIDLSQMDVVIFYLSGRHALRLKDKLERELKPGTVVMSNSFPIPGWKPSAVAKTKVLMELSVYVYVIPEKARRNTDPVTGKVQTGDDLPDRKIPRPRQETEALSQAQGQNKEL